MSTGSGRTIRHCVEHTYKQGCRLNTRKHIQPIKMLRAGKKLLDRDTREKLENTRTHRQSETIRSRGQHKITFEETVIEHKIICVWKTKWKPERDWQAGAGQRDSSGFESEYSS